MPNRGSTRNEPESFGREVGSRIRQLREQRGMSQATLAEQISVSYQQVQKYENGRTRLTLDRIAIIADALHVSLQALLTDIQPQTIQETGEDYRHDYLQRVTRDELSLLRAFRKIRSGRLRKTVIAQVRSAAKLESDVIDDR